MSSAAALLSLFLLISPWAFAENVLLDEKDKIRLDQPLPTLINFDNSIHPPQYWLQQKYSENEFLASIQPSPYSSWHKVELTGNFYDANLQHRFISVESNVLRHLNFYLFDGDRLIKEKRLGLLHPKSRIENEYRSPYFDFIIENQQTLTLLIEKQNNGPAILPMSIYTEKSMNTYMHAQDMFWVSIISILIAMAIYNAMVYAMHPSSAYLWYLGFHAVAFCYFSALNGFGYLFWPHGIQSWLANNIMLLNFILIFFVIHFADSFLQAKDNAPWHKQFIPLFRGVTLVGIVASMFIAEYDLIPLFVVFQFVASIFGISMGWVAYNNGFIPARFFLISWIFTILGGAIGMSTFINLLPVNFFTLHGFLFGTILELFLLSVALASRMKHMENLILNQLYIYPDTKVANFSYLKNHLSNNFDDIVLRNFNPVLIIANMKGFREIISIYGPQVLTKLYDRHTERITHFLSKQKWSVSLPMPSGEPVYLIALPGEQILFIVDIADGDINLGLKEIIEHVVLESEVVLNNNHTSRIQFSLGCAPIVDADFQDAFRKAQIALLTSLKSKQKWMLYTEEQEHTISERIDLINHLQQAINQNDLEIYIQPQFNLENDSVCGGEILVRWNHATLGSISPGKFIPLAEQSGSVFNITQLVFTKSCQWLAKLKNQDLLEKPFTISINLSALDLAEDNLIPYIEASLLQFDIEASWITIEVTESASMKDPQRFIHTIKRLKAIGFSISIDDFGTGYSSLMYLQDIEPDEIKIDMAFVRDIHLNRKKQHIVQCIVQLAHSNHASIVAEGVEKEIELSFITGLNCDYAQGYFWCPAIPLLDFETQYLLRRNTTPS